MNLHDIPNVQIISDESGKRVDIIGWPEFEKWARANLTFFRGVEMMADKYGLTQEDGYRFVIAYLAQQNVAMLEKLMDAEMKRPIIITSEIPVKL